LCESGSAFTSQYEGGDDEDEDEEEEDEDEDEAAGKGAARFGIRLILMIARALSK
jgi:hypothetical protein